MEVGVLGGGRGSKEDLPEHTLTVLAKLQWATGGGWRDGSYANTPWPFRALRVRGESFVMSYFYCIIVLSLLVFPLFILTVYVLLVRDYLQS